jgi:hypothetical protein
MMYRRADAPQQTHIEITGAAKVKLQEQRHRMPKTQRSNTTEVLGNPLNNK